MSVGRQVFVFSLQNFILAQSSVFWGFFCHKCFNSLNSMRPNIFLGVSDGSAQYKKWYYELVIDQVDHFVTSEPSHLRVGWANTKGYAPYPGGGEGWGGNGVGDDLYSFGFDGLHLWSGQLEEQCFLLASLADTPGTQPGCV